MPPYKYSDDPWINEYLENPNEGYCPGDTWDMTQDFHIDDRVYAQSFGNLKKSFTYSEDAKEKMTNFIDPEYADALKKLRALHEVKDIEGFFSLADYEPVLPKRNIAVASAMIKKFSDSVTSHRLGAHIKESLPNFGDFLPISHRMPSLGVHEVILAKIGDVHKYLGEPISKLKCVRFKDVRYKRESRFVRCRDWTVKRMPKDQRALADKVAQDFVQHWNYFVDFDYYPAATISAAMGIPLETIELLKYNCQMVEQENEARKARNLASNEASRLECEQRIARMEAETNANIRQMQNAYAYTYVAEQNMIGRGQAAFNNANAIVQDNAYRTGILDNANAQLNEMKRHDRALENIVANY